MNTIHDAPLVTLWTTVISWAQACGHTVRPWGVEGIAPANGETVRFWMAKVGLPVVGWMSLYTARTGELRIRYEVDRSKVRS